MPILEQDLRAGAAHYIVSEAADIYRSRDHGIIASGAGVLKAGAVLGKVTATGQYRRYTPGAADGSQNAAAILWEGCDATTEAVRRTLTLRDTAVHADMLEWAVGVTDAQKTTAMTALAALGIIGR